MAVLPRVLPLVVLGATLGATQQRGVLTRISLNPNPVSAGTPVTATATGTNPCGAVFIDWGDGTAITYPISTVPATQTHTYSAGGRFSVLAKGMGNCDGEVKATIDVAGPPAPPPPPASAATITSVDLTPASPVVRRPVDIAVKGLGACSFTVDFGDGNSQEETGTLPRTVRHTYAVADTYVMVVRPAAPCTGKFTQKIAVGTEPLRPQLTGINVSPTRTTAGQPVTIDINGGGTCSYRIDFGDGNDEKRSRPLPDRVRHNYPAPDTYTIVVNAEPPCSGNARATLVIRPRR
jgi:PKD domain